MTSKSEKKKFGGNATIVHEIKTTKTNTGLKLLTQHAVLNSLDDKKHSKAPIYRVRALQNNYRFQMWRWITEHPSRKYEGTYSMNCPPTGFFVRPKTKSCYDSSVCPWCFVRRKLMPVYDAIKDIPVKSRKGLKVAALRFEHFPAEELPFFRRDRGPHGWSDALVTAQTLTHSLVPEPDPPRREEDDPSHPPSDPQDIYHILQILPNDVNLQNTINKVLARRKHLGAPQVFDLPFYSLIDAVKVLAGSYQLPWHQLFHERNLVHFTKFKAKNSKHRLLRINAYKLKED